MRVAAGSACAARSIAQMVCRVDIAFEPSSSTVKVAEPGKVCVNRKRFLAEISGRRQALD
jgi:hypothetical protein